MDFSERSAASGTGLERLRQELRALGYVESKNIVLESRYAENKLDRLPALADELVRLKVDVLVAAQTPEATAAKNATKTIPIIFVTFADPVVAGLADSFARPGGNIMGFAILESALAGKRIELLKETIPKLSRVGQPLTGGPAGRDLLLYSGRLDMSLKISTPSRMTTSKKRMTTPGIS